VVLNGVDSTHFFPLDQDRCRTELGLQRDRKILISVGRLTAGKGHQQIIRSLAAIGGRHEVELHIIGGINPEDDFGGQLRALVAELGLANVFFVDRVAHERLALWYGAADVFCLASVREGCPNVVLESLACGTPVVATDVGSVAEVVTNGENGFLVRVDAGDELTFALDRALRVRWDRPRIASAMERWGWSRCAAEIRDVYGLVTSGDSG
jgi:glycosyltransferase involved in cell wall biosynthesis